MKNTPKNIYLQIGEDFEPDENDDFKKLVDVTWNACRINDSDLEYLFIPKSKPMTTKDKALSVLGVFVFVTVIFGAFLMYFGDRVEQKVNSAGGTSEFGTLVWVDGEIVKSWWDPVTITDSLKKARKIEAERILKTIR